MTQTINDHELAGEDATDPRDAAPWEGDAEPEQDGAPAPEKVVLGTSEQLSFAIGGKKPTGSKLTLTGGQLDVEGQYGKGERIRIVVEAEVQEVSFRDERDSKTGQVVGCARKHKAVIVSADVE
jgi:hypothetical protein